MSARTAVQAPPEDLSFEYEDTYTGGTKHPVVRQLRAAHPDHGVMGQLDYYPPKRSNGPVAIDSLYVHPEHRRKGVGSALVDEMQRMHPDSTLVHGDRTDDGQKWWDGYTEGRPVRRGRTAMPHQAGWSDQAGGSRTWNEEKGGYDEPGEDEYRMQHRPPDRDGIPIHDLTHNLPADVYTHPHYYSDMSEPSNQVAHQVIRRVRGNPEAKVHIYRALPAEHAQQGFRPGDWVSTSKDYARQHGVHATDPQHDWPVIRTTVRAKDLHTDGDDFREYGYNGDETKRGMVAFKGGRHQEISQRADGSVGKVERRQSPVKGYSFTGEDHRDVDEMMSDAPTRGIVHAWAPGGGHAGHVKYRQGEVEEVHVEPEHQHVADELERRMRMKMPKEGSMMDRTAVHLGFVDPADRSKVVPGAEPGLPRIVAHVSGNSIDIMHCPFCGSGAVLARSDGTVECNFCTSVFTVQVQPQFAAFPQTAEGMPYQWPGQPGPDQLAGGGDGAMGGFPGPVAGEPDPEADDNPFGASADGGGEEDDPDEAAGGAAAPDDVEGTKAQVGGKDAPPFTKKKSYRTAAGYQLGEEDYLRHLAISAAHHRGKVARLVRESR